MPSFLPHRISPPSKLVVLNQACLDLPTASSEERKWGDDEEVEVTDNEDSSRRLDKGKAPMESQNADDMNESTEDSTAFTPGPRRSRRARNRQAARMTYARLVNKLPTSSSERRKWGDDCSEEEAESEEEGYAQITMDFREPRSPVGSIDSDTPIVRLDANILHPRALRMLGFTTKEGLELEGMTEALTTMFKDPADYVLEAPRARSVMKQLDRAQEVHSQVSSSSSFTTGDTGCRRTPSAMPHRQIIPRETSTPNNAAGRAPEPIRSLVKLNQSCVELPTSSSERRKWGDDCVEEEAESDEEGPFLSQSDPSLITLNQECDVIPSSSSSDEGNDTDEEEEEAYFESDPSEICDDDDNTEMEDDMAEATRGFEQLYMPRGITQAQWEEIEQYAEGTNKEVALHELITPRKPRRQRKPRPRTVNGLLKTALGPPPGSTTTLSPVQDITFRSESVKCLVTIIKSMGMWMDQQLKKGVSLFNRKPSKGIDFLMSTKKIGNSPEDVASFLKNTTGLNPTIIGDYLGEREEFPLKVMHAYVDSFNFEGMDFGESIRYFLRGFRLPGEAQKIDRIMEKFAERYCKCNPNSFTSADTAYVLAYSVIMLNTDKMTKADFIRNNRGINDGNDLPEDYLGALYDQIVKNEIKMKADSSVPQNKQGGSLNKLLGLDGILNLVWKQREEKPLCANGVLVRHIQEQFKAKSGKSESIYYVIADPAILRFMVEVCWGPMLAAFSVTLDQSDDKNATSQCLLGFRHAVHITAVMGMQTQRDVFVTSMAKFTNLHCAADMKQKNVDTMKAIMSIAIEDGNHLHEAWEHILTCLSRFEHLQLLGEGAPSDSSFFTTSSSESEEKLKSAGFPSLKKKGTLQNPTMAAVVRGGSYDSATVGANSPALVTPEQINNFISNLNLLDQIGDFELNHIFAHSQRLNSEAIVAFVKALSKVSMSELQSPTDPRVFSLTKIVEVAHYNMNRIRLVWSHIWSVLSEFFVAVERDELANYNFQNEFLRPFVIVTQKSNSAEIRELIVRCISQMVMSRVNNVKSGWKSVFMVFTAAAADERKNIVLLAFETMEKIVREYFRYITETETLTFTDCVRCLITFTNSRFNSDVSLNAIAFLRFCAIKLAEGGLVSNEKNKNNDSFIPVAEKEASDGLIFTDKDDYMSFWEPLLTGLSRLTSDPRSAIRKSALEVLFNILKDHGHLFPRLFWINVFKSVIYPIFSPVNDSTEARVKYDQSSFKSRYISPDGCLWDSETSVVAAQCLVDLFVNFFAIVRSELPSVVSIMVGFIKGSGKDPAATGVASVTRLAGDLRGKFCEEERKVIFLALKEASYSTLPNFLKLLRTMDDIEISTSQSENDMETSSGAGLVNDESEDDNLHTAGYVVSRMKDHIAAQLRIIQVSSDLYKMCRQSVSADTVNVLLGIYSAVTSHAQQLKSEKVVQVKLQKACSILEIPEPPLVFFENESYQNYLNFLHGLLVNNSSFIEEKNIEPELVGVCEEILRVYLDCAGLNSVKRKPVDKAIYQWNLPLGSAKKEELVARTPLVLSVIRILCSWQTDSFRKYISQLFPLMIDLVRSEHSSGEVQRELSHFFQSCIGPIIIKL
ncbi:hypothetical protein K7X08_037179 [Anisodus acutangulus]|uniref:SEC7 domain-containing protein n=1 Tax=Anisodus acutangulus TaxID=402998 RepID=A0A9Q1L7P2_9SOLA|nr:hypothetical protein K7X08_037179 [Anisodus acutangulus]